MTEIIVVEGRSDTVAIRRAIEADTIETGGSALGEDVFARIELAAETRGVIVFTDPDYAGERIRKLVARRVPNCKHAFIDAEQGMRKGRVGVEFASPVMIREALAKVWTESADVTSGGEPMSDLYEIRDLLSARLINGPDAGERRMRLGKLLRIGYGNGKQLLKRLNMFRVAREQFEAALTQLDLTSEQTEADHE